MERRRVCGQSKAERVITATSAYSILLFAHSHLFAMLLLLRFASSLSHSSFSLSTKAFLSLSVFYKAIRIEEEWEKRIVPEAKCKVAQTGQVGRELRMALGVERENDWK